MSNNHSSLIELISLQQFHVSDISTFFSLVNRPENVFSPAWMCVCSQQQNKKKNHQHKKDRNYNFLFSNRKELNYVAVNRWKNCISCRVIACLSRSSELFSHLVGLSLWKVEKVSQKKKWVTFHDITGFVRLLLLGVFAGRVMSLWVPSVGIQDVSDMQYWWNVLGR